MNQLKRFLQDEIRRSYKYITKALATTEFAERCVLDLGLDKLDEHYRDDFVSLICVIEEAFSELERYLMIKEK